MKIEKYGFVYIWRDRKHNRYYIGSHWGNINDFYICSSRWMRKSYNRRPEDFKRRIIKTNIKDRKETLLEEHRFLSMIKKEELGKKYYNLRNCEFNHWSASEIQQSILTINEKMSLAWDKKKASPDYDIMIKKMSDAKIGKPSWNKGIEATEEHKIKMSQCRQGQIWITNGIEDKIIYDINDLSEGWHKGRSTIKGRKHSEEHKKKISEAGKLRVGEKRSDITKSRISESKKGNLYNLGKKRSEKSKNKISDSLKGQKWITNGIENKKISKDGIAPEGWYRGRIITKKPK